MPSSDTEGPVAEIPADASPRLHGLAVAVAERAWVSSPASVVAVSFVAAYTALTAALLALGVLLTPPVVGANWTVSVDRSVARSLADCRTDVVDVVARGASWLASTPTVIALVLGVGILLGVNRRWAPLSVLLAAIGLELAVYTSVTYAVARPRPDVALGELPITGSFPSGHAAMSVALWGALAVAVRWSTNDERVTRGAAVGVVAVAIGVGTSRLYLGLHYLFDVILGWLLGAAALAVAVLIGRLVALATEHRWPAADRPVTWPQRVGHVATIAGAVVLALLVWGCAIEPRFVLATREFEAGVPGLPEEWDGKRIGVIADLQVGMWLDNTGMMRQAVDELVESEPDVVLILGDFVYGEDHSERNVRTAVEIVDDLPEAGIPTLAVLGNHDFDAGASELLVERLRSHGVEVLRNEAVPLQAAAGGPPLWIVGIGPERPGAAAPAAALAPVPPDAARVVMMHNPQTFEELPAGSAPFALAGHTHGGQIRVPFLPEWSLLRLLEGHSVHADGWIPDYGAPGNRLFVDRGIGMSVVPIRINCSPVVTVFELRSEVQGTRLGIGASMRYLSKNKSIVMHLLAPRGFDPTNTVAAFADDADTLGIEAIHSFTFNAVADTRAWQESFT